MTDTLPPFPGFRPEAFAFLRELSAHNERDWFKPRKEIYQDEVLWPLECLVADVAREAHRQRLPLTGDPKTSIFRIYRDFRFSKNKNPYKTHASALFSPGGTRGEDGVVYVHIQPDASFLGAGFWEPDARLLNGWRTRMIDDPAGFLEVVERLEAAGLTLRANDALKRLPRGFEQGDETPVGPFLRWRSFLTYRSVSDEELLRPDFTNTVLRMIRDTLPLLEYGWQLAREAERTPFS